MSPRPYNLGKRNEHINEGRRQVLDAARAMLAEATSYSDFTVDAVAKRADVARGTVYYQFKSKAGLLEALCDELGRRGGLDDLANAFANPDPNEALASFVMTFARFWQVDRPVMRRLRALAHLDPDIRTVIVARDERRREGLQELVKRFPQATSSTKHDHALPGPTDLLLALTSFETFDTIAAPNQDLITVAPSIAELASSILQPPPPQRRGRR